MIYWYRKYCKGCVVNMKKLLQLFMVLALLVVPSMCLAQKQFPDGTVLNDKEEAVYEITEKQAIYFVEPASIRFKGVGAFSDIKLKWYNEGTDYIEICISAKNRMGGRTTTTYHWYKDGREESYNGVPDFITESVDCSKLNHLWETYHANDF